MRAFAKVVELRGFAAAARALQLSTAMVSKHVAALEQRLGVQLLVRTTRRVAPTESGQRYHAHCTEILAAVDDAEREVGAQARAPVGCLRVTAPVELGNLHIAPLVPGMLRRHPGLNVALSFTNRVLDLVEEGVDVAVRVAPALDSNLRGRQITTSRLLLVATPGYLRRHGTPRAPHDLQRHATLSFALSLGAAWPFVRGEERLTLQMVPRLLSNSSEAVRTAACAGEGIALLPTFLAAADLEAGRLRTVLPQWSHGSLRIFALYPHRKAHPARLQAFIDVLLERFGDDPERDGFLAR